MNASSSKSPSPMLVAVLAGLVVGVPAGYMASAVVGGHDRVQAPMSDPHAGMAGMKGTPPGEAASTTAFRKAAERMHADMGDRYTGDADLDFARGMVPHHQGAVDMARIEIEHGRDPAMRDLASRVVETQESEIALMRRWIAAHPAH
jgi:uncharacterized protein (DUF305 family)